MSKDFAPRFCDKCGGPKNEIQGDREVILRCTCDWERGFHERLKSTVPAEFWKEKVFSIRDWNPPIFRKGGDGIFKNLIKIQKTNAVLKLYEFCHRLIKRDEKGMKYYALDRSIDRSNNLFMRGTVNSGRGTLMAQIKIFAAHRDISATPNPGDWSVFKSEMAQSEWHGKDAEFVKTSVAEQYRNVKVLTLENVRGEGTFGLDRQRRPFRSANLIDVLLTQRNLKPGCMAFTSDEFAKEIGDTMGDKLPEILASPKTSLILLFSSTEADALQQGLIKYYEKTKNAAEQLKKGDKLKFQEQLTENRLLECAEEAFYIEHLFPRIPATKHFKFDETESLSYLIENDAMKQVDPWSPKIRTLRAEFIEEKELNGLSFQLKIDKVLINVVRECSILSQKMTEKEMLETGRMMSDACSGVERSQQIIATAKDIREKFFTE